MVGPRLNHTSALPIPLTYLLHLSYPAFKMERRSPCASCKLRRRRCPRDCIFAPYFPSGDPQKFANVNKIFGPSYIRKRLQGVPVDRRGEVVSSLLYAADARMRDPVNGCVGDIWLLQIQVSELQKQVALSQAQIPCIHNHEAAKGGKGKEVSETASGVAARDKKHEVAESSDAAVKRMRLTVDLNQLPSDEDEYIMP